MRAIELGDTLAALARSIEPAESSGLIVTSAEMDVPLEVQSAINDGQLVFFGVVPHSRWKAGFLPPVHLSHLRFELVSEETNRGRR